MLVVAAAAAAAAFMLRYNDFSHVLSMDANDYVLRFGIMKWSVLNLDAGLRYCTHCTVDV